ncbi:membrane protein [Thalassotalea insulae]|uniref:Membrane protein n=1 Tax=Thalassotalea insulae TaxID=2056778 RepID=A0ABQ6GRU7_9GAMM|nr:lysoplasmalogenase [Thalassotalea insulae]GLX78683.1 membrane protein [Thalassotalea insulae]
MTTKTNNNQLNTLFGLTAIIYLISLSFSPYSLQFSLKALPILLLLVAVQRSSRCKDKTLLTLALIASGAGDVLLALPISNSFILGLGAFLIAQLVYTVSFIRARVNKPNKVRKIVAVLVLAFAIAMAFYILPDTGELMVPVTVYLFVITCMGLCALLSGIHLWVAVGALSFISSDAMLALSIFKTPLPFSDQLVMLSYYLAQFFIINGMLKQQDDRTAIS